MQRMNAALNAAHLQRPVMLTQQLTLLHFQQALVKTEAAWPFTW